MMICLCMIVKALHIDPYNEMMSMSKFVEGSSSKMKVKFMSYVCTMNCGNSSKLLVMLRVHSDVTLVFLVNLVH